MTSQCALLIMDMQQRIVDNYGGTPQQLASVHEARTAAQEAGVPVIFVVIEFAEGYGDLHRNNRALRGLREAELFTSGDPGARICEELKPTDGDIVVTKKRQSAFTGSALEVTLRSLGISRIVVAGTSTSGVVLSTVRQAADLDYEITILSDGCADPQPDVHDFLMSRIFPHQGDVVSVQEWTSSLVG